MGLFKNIIGIMGNALNIGGPASGAVQLKNNSGTLEARSFDGSALTNVNAANATSDTHLVTRLDLKHAAGIEVSFGFDGGSPPAAGTNTGGYGMCGKSGGSYTAGDIVYDSGTALQAVTILTGQKITTSVAVSGTGYTVTTIQNGVYAATGVSPNVWSLRGDGTGSNTGTVLTIGPLTVGTSATTDSTTSIPNGATVKKVWLNVTTPYSAGTKIAITVNGSTPQTIMATTDNVATLADTYTVEQVTAITSSSTGHVRTSVNGSPGAGACTVMVDYITAGQA
jgi:hypothetical protein